MVVVVMMMVMMANTYILFPIRPLLSIFYVLTQ